MRIQGIRKVSRQAVRCKLFVWPLAAFVGLTGCSGGGGGGDTTAAGPTGGWLTITEPPDQSSTVCNTDILRGEAFISTDWYRCCSGSAEDTGVTVSWENLVSGDNGAADQSVDICFFFGTPYLCNHTWSATVPLVLGDNIIRVTAVDPDGRGDSATLTVFKPEYSYSVAGTVMTHQGVPVGHFQSGVELVLGGAHDSTAIPSSGGTQMGEYAFSCVPNGSYRVEAVSPAFDYAFAPAFHDFSVADADINGLDFVTEAYAVSGALINAPTTVRVEIASSTASWSWPLQPDDIYTYIVPPGSYRVTPSDWFCVNCVFDPDFMAIDVTDSALTGLDFEWFYFP